MGGTESVQWLRFCPTSNIGVKYRVGVIVQPYSFLLQHHLRWSMECVLHCVLQLIYILSWINTTIWGDVECVLHCITHTVNLYSGLNQHHLRRNMECVLQFIYVLSRYLQWYMERALQCLLQCVYVLPWHSIIWGEKWSVSVLQYICVLSCHLRWNIECPLQYIYVLSWRSTIRGEVLYQWRVQRMYYRPTAYRRPAQRDCL